MQSISSAAAKFIHTNFLARQQVRRNNSNARKVSFFVICMGILTMLCFFIFLWVRIYVLEIGYQLSSVHENHERLRQENGKLIIERASLRAPSRIEDIARNKLGMVVPDSSQVVVLMLRRPVPVTYAAHFRGPGAGQGLPINNGL
jgi:cell division protein FtsL